MTCAITLDASIESWLMSVRVERNASSDFKLGVFQHHMLKANTASKTNHIHSITFSIIPWALNGFHTLLISMWIELITNHSSSRLYLLYSLLKPNFWELAISLVHIDANNHWHWLICEKTNQSIIFYLIFRMGKSGTKSNCESKMCTMTSSLLAPPNWRFLSQTTHTHNGKFSCYFFHGNVHWPSNPSRYISV